MELAWWPNSLVSTAPPVILSARDVRSPIKKSARATRSTALATAIACILGGSQTVSESSRGLPTCRSPAPPAFLILSLPPCIYISSAVTGLHTVRTSPDINRKWNSARHSCSLERATMERRDFRKVGVRADSRLPNVRICAFAIFRYCSLLTRLHGFLIRNTL
ncbi:unnamed protein product [Nezara viridula]|uniref:Uncharacterized protein n=1 Tax=Nezara viridula TaxID=85310 RepID=A0A9P0E192_NEZVI|nr:unnamed protein product [Nezara viridula]